jgi:hypothetical protein
MEAATYVLFTLGCLGAADIAIYHGLAHGLRRHPDARGELIAHSVRGPTYAALFLLVPNVTMQGWWFWVLVGVLTFDAAISLWDFAIERSSRGFFGGLPTGEYVLHTVLAMLFGALVCCVFFEAGSWAALPTRFGYQPAAVPVPLRVLLAVMAGLVFLSGILDVLAVYRLRGQPRRADQPGRQPNRVRAVIADRPPHTT